MLDWIAAHAPGLIVPLTIGLLVLVGAAETVVPYRAPSASATRRWATNLGLWLTNHGAIALLAPAAFAAWLLEAAVELPRPFAVLQAVWGDVAVVVAGVLLIDLFAYLTHRLSHAVPLLWRFHAVHHADAELDASTAFRHHPGEYLVNATAASLAFTALGVPPGVFAVYAALSLISELLQHANLSFPGRLSSALSAALVTPALHRTHHSTTVAHHGSNFGTVLSIWDRLFGTLQQLDPEDARRLKFGLPSVSGERDSPWRALSMPLRAKPPGRAGRGAHSSSSVEPRHAQAVDDLR